MTENKNFKAIYQPSANQKLFRRTHKRRGEDPQAGPPGEPMIDLVEGITDGFFVLDKGFRVQVWNHGAERITGLSSAEMVGQYYWDKAPKRVIPTLIFIFHKALKNKATISFEQYNEGLDRWLEKSIYPSPRGLFVHFKEITIRKKRGIHVTGPWKRRYWN